MHIEPIRGACPMLTDEPLSWPDVKTIIDQMIEDFEAAGHVVLSVDKIYVDVPVDPEIVGAGRGVIFEGQGIAAEAVA